MDKIDKILEIVKIQNDNLDLLLSVASCKSSLVQFRATAEVNIHNRDKHNCYLDTDLVLSSMSEQQKKIGEICKQFLHNQKKVEELLELVSLRSLPQGN